MIKRERTMKIAPSILAADMLRYAEEVTSLADSVEMLHIDIMDGSFVPEITFGTNLVSSLRKFSNLFLDVHLMIDEPAKHLDRFAAAGSQRIYVHTEISPHLHRDLGRIRELGVSPGVALNPSTPAEAVFEVLELVDVVLVMSVNPGWGGQRFIPSSLPKISRLKAESERRGLPCEVAVDGGINAQTAKECASAGATILIAGSSVFGISDRIAAVKSLQISA